MLVCPYCGNSDLDMDEEGWICPYCGEAYFEPEEVEAREWE